MKVYILEMGVYEERSIMGVFDSAERAMAAAGGKWERRLWCNASRKPFGYWQEWTNDGAGGRVASITEEDLCDTGPVADKPPIIMQRYVSQREWAYDPISEAEAIKLLSYK